MDDTDPKGWLVRQWRRFCRRWPWASKARLRRLAAYVMRRRTALVQRHRDALQVAVNERAVAERQAAFAETLVRRQHLVLEALVELVGGRERFLWEYAGADRRTGLGQVHAARALIHEVDGRMGSVRALAYMTPVAWQAERGPASSPFRHVDIPLHRFAVSIGLSPDTPPEVVAADIAEKVRAAVMEKWAGQSVLAGASR